MHPILFEWGHYKIHFYGVLIVVGFLFSMPFVVKKGVQLGLERRLLVNVCYLSLISGFIGARLVYILVNWSEFSADPVGIFDIRRGGLVFYGGLMGGMLGFYVFSLVHKLPILTLFDVAAAPLAINQMFGRLGCFMAGCCWGKECALDFPLRVQFSHPLAPAPHEVWLHPVQLYEAAFLIFLGFSLMLIYKKRQFEGQVVASYLILYAIGRFVIEFFRGDDLRGFIFQTHLSTSQGISIILFSLGLWIWFRGLKFKA